MGCSKEDDELEMSELEQKLMEKLTPEERESVKPAVKRPYVPPQLRGFKLHYNVGEISVSTDVKIKALEVKKDTSIYEKNKLTGNKLKNRPFDKSTGKILPAGYGFKQVDEITGLEVPDSQRQKIQLRPDPNSPTQLKEVEVSSFSKTEEASITDLDVLPRQVLNDALIEKEYQVFGVGAELWKVVKSLAEKKSVGRIKDFVLTESDNAYIAFVCPPAIFTEDRFYLTIKLARRKRESLITAWLNSNDMMEMKEKKIKLKTGQKIDTNIDEF